MHIYAFDGPTYTGYNKTTDEDGEAIFTLPQGDYRFRSDKNGTQFWSYAENHCTVPGCLSTLVTTTIPLTVTVKNEGGVPQEELRVYAFNGTSYTGYNKTTDVDSETIFTLPQGDYRFRVDSEGEQFWSGESNHCTIPSCLSAPVTVPGGIVAETTVITYTYDPLYRLTAADYDNGDSFAYTYDSTGNRLIKEECLSGLECLTTAYAYDIANRLVTVQDGVLPAVSYQWDANGNLLNDGENTYAYNHANRLSSVTGPQSESSYAYNGMGDRIQQTVDGETTTYTLDTAIGLTQVLADGENIYLYGLGRIAQLNTDPLKTEYFLTDALGSVRQLADESGVVTLVKGYQPYGDVMSSSGGGVSSYGFTGEWTDVSGMVYLRARYYSPWNGRFVTRDTWRDDYSRPLSLNKWLYVYANPVNLTDPSGFDPWWCENPERYPTDDAKRQCYDDWLAGTGYGSTSSEVNLVLLCGTDMWGSCQGNYGNPNGSYEHGYKGVQPLTPAKNWAINKGYTFQFYGTKGINAESKALTIAGSMVEKTDKYGTKHIIIGFSGGASFSTLVALRATDTFHSGNILLVVQMDSEIKANGPGNTNTENNFEILEGLGLGIYACHSEAYEQGYVRFTRLWPFNYSSYERPEYSILLPGVETHKEMAVRQDIFNTYIKPELERAVNSIP